MFERTLWYSDLRNDCYAAGFEFLGTCVFLIMSLGTAQSLAVMNAAKPEATLSTSSDYMFVSAGFGLALLVAAWLFFRVSGALFNPNVSTALALVGAISPHRAILYIVAQMVGAICAAAVVSGLMPGAIAFNTTPSIGINKAQALFIEMCVTAFLCFAVLMLAVEKHSTTPFAPLWSIPLTGGAVNTARAFGPAVVSGHFGPAHWVYWLGPTLGSVLASAVYIIVKRSQYWTLAPDQDATDPRKSLSGVLLTGSSPTSPNTLGGARDSYVDSGVIIMQRAPDPAIRAEDGQNFHRDDLV
ncbi:aquaporin-like protein [Auriculariales sp. MPI-PUGE-AT-0066]|nr:aquaporin-like protein [Auriculariales sp. MPI-PUGE-AT-0066]